VKHYGDITKINGADVEPVWIITGGSPCQDLSIAGRRAGLDGERSGLFMEQIRIIKEMREYDRSVRGSVDDIRCIRPRFMVWENVPGAFSSNNGEDFRVVLEETAKVADENAVIPRPENGKWTPSGCILGNGWSIAWRTTDNQFWGTPQRRRRIALVADFAGECAPEILFERKSVSGDIEPIREKGEETSRDSLSGIDPASTSNVIEVETEVEVRKYPVDREKLISCLQAHKNGSTKEIADALGKPKTLVDHWFRKDSYFAIPDADIWFELKRMLGIETDEFDECITCFETKPGNYDMQNRIYIGEKSPIITANQNYFYCLGEDAEQNLATICIGNGQLHDALSPSVEVSKTLNCMDDPMKIITYGLDRASFNQGQNAQYDFSVQEEIAQTLVSKGPGGVLTTQ